MKKIIVFLPLLLSSLITYPVDTRVTLESSVISIADGKFIDADKIEFIKKFRRMLLASILGEQMPNNQRKGKYRLGDKYYSIEALARIEQEVSAGTSKRDLEIKSALEELLTHAKADFIVQSNEFIESGRGAKNIMIVLIQEDCAKRNRSDSLLLEWAKTKEGLESTMFEKHITSFGLYYYFLADLVNFLLDLTHSCPKAEAQFRDRVAKWSAVKEILPVIFRKAHIKSDQVNEVEFLRYLKERYLDRIALSEITPQIIVPLLVEYSKHLQING